MYVQAVLVKFTGRVKQEQNYHTSSVLTLLLLEYIKVLEALSPSTL